MKLSEKEYTSEQNEMHSAGNYQYNKCASIHVHPSLLAKGLQSTLLLYNPFADLADYVGN